MEKIVRFTAEERDNLVAYLDGELGEAMTQQIEHKLALSEVARHELDNLSRTWEMLNLLPCPKASEEFTNKTLSMAQLSTADFPGQAKIWIQQSRRIAILLGWIAGLFVLCFAGFQLGRRAVPQESDQLIRELPVIENLDLYQEIESVEFLEELRRSGLFVGVKDGQK